MKRYLLLLAAIAAAVVAQAYDINYAGCYRSVVIEFESIDEDNAPITLSELVTLPLERDAATARPITFCLVSSMPFNMDDNRVPTGEQPFDANLLRTIATEGALCVQVDGQGFGASKGKTLPFLINNLNARQSIDGLFAAMDYALAQGYTLCDDYYTLAAGYSLDGGRTVAIQRYIEQHATDEERARLRFRKAVIGGAPINAVATAQFILESGRVSEFTEFLSLFEGFYKSNNQGAMHAIAHDEMFAADSTLRPEIIAGTSVAGRAFWRALSQQNMNEGWVPETPITAIHLTDDDLVTYQNAKLALNSWGKEKFVMVDKSMSKMHWNAPLLRLVPEVMNQYMTSMAPHFKGAANFYAGMVDGCLRDTIIADTYGRTTNFYDMLTMIFDLASKLSIDIPINMSGPLANGTFTIKTLGYCHFTGSFANDEGRNVADVDATLRPEALDSLATGINTVDGAGYLHLPLDFDIQLHLKMLSMDIELPIHGQCSDLYRFVQNLSAAVLYHNCETEEEAVKFCNAINETMNVTSTLPLLGNECQIIAWYTEPSGSDSHYSIAPFVQTGDIKLPLASIITQVGDYLTIDGKTITIGGYAASMHVTEDLHGEVKFYADITKVADSTYFGRANFDLKAVPVCDDSTRVTTAIDFEVLLKKLPIRLTGACSNLHDAVMAAILCYCNLDCPTEAQAQLYADAVNNNVTMEFYSIMAGSDPDNPQYFDYGPMHASVFKDQFGAYFVQYCLNFMGKSDLPLSDVIKMFFN